MKKLTVLSLSGKKLFTGTRQKCKAFVRANKVQRYKFIEKFVEKETENFLAKAKTKEGHFNEIF